LGRAILSKHINPLSVSCVADVACLPQLCEPGEGPASGVINLQQMRGICSKNYPIKGGLLWKTVPSGYPRLGAHFGIIVSSAKNSGATTARGFFLPADEQHVTIETFHDICR
jgi:hypothetical protein